MSRVDAGPSPAERARLAHKGRLLYGKFCGTKGRGICAERFALYHIWRGEPESPATCWSSSMPGSRPWPPTTRRAVGR